MGRLLVVAGCVASLVVVAGCGGDDSGDRVRPAPSAWTTWTDRDAHLRTDVPRGWHVTEQPLTAVINPVQRLVVSSFAIRQRDGDRSCGPDTAREQMPADGAMVYMMETPGPTEGLLARIPARPDRFRLRRSARATYECLGRSYAFSFQEHRRLLQAHVYVGRRASAATRAKAVAVLDRLRVGRVNPVDAAVWHPPGVLLARAPYLGVACPQANSIACDRVGLAVWLRHAAESVTATIQGRALRLDDDEWSGPALPNGRRRMFAGFLQPAGLLDGPLKVKPEARSSRWYGRTPVRAGVRLTIRRSGEHYTRTSLVVPLAAGWG
jgi:hypothetical protein